MKRILSNCLFWASISYCFFINITSLSAQTQTVKGRIFDIKTDEPLIGASVVANAGKQGVLADDNGNFSLQLPYGRHALVINFLGYKAATLPDVLVTAGKEVILEIGLEESVVKMAEIVVKAENDKSRSVNELATVSTKSFSPDEVLRYSGSRNDIARMAANFAGVFVANDQRNDLVIRGNSPVGVQYRLEGINIPNPNHFATLGTTGGPVSAINPNLLKKSDFLTGAFPAEYGNATAGVFDIGLKTGNKDKREFTVQLGAFTGLEVTAEGPLSKKSKNSFILGYRHSFLELIKTFNLFGLTAVPEYKDLSFKLDFAPNRFGKFSIFGIGGLSSIQTHSTKTEAGYATSKLGTVGLEHRFLIDNQSYIKTTIGLSGSESTFDSYKKPDSLTHFKNYGERDVNQTLTVASVYNRKISARHSLRIGSTTDFYYLKSFSQSLQKDNTTWTNNRDFADNLTLTRAYAQWQYKPTDPLSILVGLHTQYLSLNKDFVVEPRFSVNWTPTDRDNFSFGYGLHHQAQPLPIYLEETAITEKERVRTNQNLKFTQSQHLVLGYSRRLAENWRIKADVYYQAISRVPIESKPSTFSLLNYGSGFGFPSVDSLINGGKGWNYGVELTIEKYFSRGYYGLITTSLFNSKYVASDNVTRNSAFNNQFIFNFLTGKEFKLKGERGNVITLDTRLTNALGRFYTPIDLDKSKIAGTAVFDYSQAFSSRFSPFFRWDARLGYRINGKKSKISHQFFGEVQNLTAHRNPFVKQYNAKKASIYTEYQVGLFFDLMYRIQF